MALGLGAVTTRSAPAWAQGEEEDEEEGGGDEGGDEGGVGDEEEEGEEQDKNQPPVTAGGLFTMATYPVRENSRPLTMTEGIAQVRLAVGTDISAKGAFESAGVNLEAQYGLKDNVTLMAGVTNAYNFKQFGVYAGFEASLFYDVVDFRAALNVHRNAIANYDNFCNPPATPGEIFDGAACGNANATVDLLPSGKFDAGGTKFSLDIGFPFRYAIRPEIAIVALQTLMSIDFNSVTEDFVTIVPIEGAAEGQPQFNRQVKGNGAKPDLNPSVGIATNPISALSIVIFAQLRIPDFDTSAGAFQIPITGRIEFSPNQKLDIGLEFTLLNLKPPEPQSPIDNRFLSLFAQARFGK